MLFFAAAILISSVHVLGVAGPTAVPVSDVTAQQMSAPSHHVSATATPVSLVDSRIAPGREVRSAVSLAPAVAAGDLTACRGEVTDAAACLDGLGTAPVATLERFGRSLDSDTGEDVAFATAIGRQGSATATRSWWQSLGLERRTALATALPSIVGNLEGIPYTIRDAANRLTLESTLQRLSARAAQSHEAVGRSAEAPRVAMLDQVQAALAAGADRSLLSLDTVFPGRAAVAVGDVDRAANVSVIVPGMLYTVTTQMVSLTGAAADLQSSQTFWSNTLSTSVSHHVATSAVVAWMGYKTPGLTNVLGIGLATTGARQLEDAIQGLDADRRTDMPRVTLIAHSYGSTTSTIALSSGRIRVDDFVAMGSPGSVVATASKLDVTAGHVFVAAAALDPVAGSAVFGADPGSMAFGAKELNLGAMVDPYTEQRVTAVVSHNEYFTAGSHSMRSLALIGIGRGDLADGRRPDPGAPELTNGPSLGLVRPQDINRESVGA